MMPDESVGAYNRDATARDRENFKGRHQHQSPINLVSHDAVYSPRLLEDELTVAYGGAAARYAELVNSGDALELHLSQAAEEECVAEGDKTNCTAFIKGGPLPRGHAFKLECVKFHWGKEDDRGSEHTINSYAYPMEVQFVHWNTSLYSSFDDALGKEDGVATIGVFVQIGRLRSTSVGAIVEQLEAVRYKGQRTILPAVAPFTLASLLPDPTLRDYWTYDGSLTSSPFCENVTWIIFRYPLTLTHVQIEEFRRLKSHSRNKSPEAEDDDGFLSDNFRSPLPVNRRVILASFQ